jgi:SAM-dependent methyltransferase
MNDEELLLFNKGERLIPGVSHNNEEYIRHRSSYDFFIKIIKEDSKNLDISILDLGCGVGWGCKLLAESLPNARVTGLDNSSDALYYAKRRYGHFRVDYGFSDMANKDNLLILNTFSHDYIVCRGVLEHIDNGLELIKYVSYDRILIFDVPYNESPGNLHHKLYNITEAMFKDWKNIEFYYEAFNDGSVSKIKQPDVNMLMCVCRTGVPLKSIKCP